MAYANAPYGPSFGGGMNAYGQAQPWAMPGAPQARPFARPGPYGPEAQGGMGVMGGGGDPRLQGGGGGYSPFMPQRAAMEALQQRQQLGAAQAMAPAAPYSPWQSKIPEEWLSRARAGFSRPGGQPQAPPTRFAPQMSGGLMRSLTRAF